MFNSDHIFDLLFLYSLYDLDHNYKHRGLDPIIITDAKHVEMTFFNTFEIIHNAIGMLKTDCLSMTGLYEDGDFYEYSKTPAYHLLLKAPDYLYDKDFSIIGLNDVQNEHDTDHDGYFSITAAGLFKMGVLYTDTKGCAFIRDSFKQSTIDGLDDFYQNSGLIKTIIDNANEFQDAVLGSIIKNSND